MATFSERNGYSSVPEKMVPESMTKELRNLLWNVIDNSVNNQQLRELAQNLWHNFYKLPIDSIPYTSGYNGVSYAKAWQHVREKYFSSPWNGVYDLVEFLVQNNVVKAEHLNTILIQESAAYRIIGGKVCQITDNEEIAAVNEALVLQDRYKPVAEHISAALAHFSQRQSPNYRNTIKESILAVESMAKIITSDNNATLGKVLNKLESNGKINGALKSGFSSIYGWTSDTNGIRHAMTEASSVDHVDAKFFLVACSAFANYLKARGM